MKVFVFRRKIDFCQPRVEKSTRCHLSLKSFGEEIFVTEVFGSMFFDQKSFGRLSLGQQNRFNGTNIHYLNQVRLSTEVGFALCIQPFRLQILLLVKPALKDLCHSEKFTISTLSKNSIKLGQVSLYEKHPFERDYVVHQTVSAIDCVNQLPFVLGLTQTSLAQEHSDSYGNSETPPCKQLPTQVTKSTTVDSS